jgi:hypothetical protein
MKKYINKIGISIGAILMMVSCTELDLAPLDAANSKNWYNTDEQFRISLNEGYRPVFFPLDGDDGGSNKGWDDDVAYRNVFTEIRSGTVNSEFYIAKNSWTNTYKGITRMLTVLNKIQNDNTVLSPIQKSQFEGETKFLLATYWSYLITHFGDVPFYDKSITVDESFIIPRTDKAIILQKIYEYYDFAAQNLPKNYIGSADGLEYATKGAALAYKTRIALYMGDNLTAATAAKACIDLKEYTLHSNFEELFLSKTKKSSEIIFKIPRSIKYLQTINTTEINNLIPRNNGGFGSVCPSWQLLASFECVDGLPIDESPLFDPRNPFKNRDPRLLATIVPFGSYKTGDGRTSDMGSRHIDKEFNPHPQHTRITNYTTNNLETNLDTKSNQNFCSWNGLVWKKGIDSDWGDKQADNDLVFMRYADVLLMYAEAKMELNDINTEVLSAINLVRTRAYANSAFSTPLVTTTDQAKLRYIIRNERRAEFAFERLRYMDLIRWKLADVIMDGGENYGLSQITANASPSVVQANSELMLKVVNPGNWFWGMTPQLDKNGVADFKPLSKVGLCQLLSTSSFPKKQYLWPIPADERRLNPSLSQNDGY